MELKLEVEELLDVLVDVEVEDIVVDADVEVAVTVQEDVLLALRVELEVRGHARRSRCCGRCRGGRQRVRRARGRG